MARPVRALGGNEMSTSQFDYLLNAFEQASQSEDPFHAQYAEKRTALFEYVWELERKALPPEAEAIETLRFVREVIRHSPIEHQVVDLDTMTGLGAWLDARLPSGETPK